MTNCCDSWGRCQQGLGCPVREAAYTKAAEKHFDPDLKVQMFDGPSRLNRALDWLGNLPHKVRKFAKDQDFDSPAEMLLVAAVLVFACYMTAPILVGWMK